MQLLTPSGAGREPTAQEKEDFLAQQVEGELRAFTFATFQQLIAVRLAKRGEFEQKTISDIAGESMDDAMAVTLQAVTIYNSHSTTFETAARTVAKSIIAKGKA